MKALLLRVVSNKWFWVGISAAAMVIDSAMGSHVGIRLRR